MTRFAPAPTGHLHLGHVANALWTWGVARAIDGRVLLRIEDHDQQRCRPEYATAILEDLAWLGLSADAGPVRQSDPESLEAYTAALEQIEREGLVYGCACTRSTFTVWAETHRRSWSGPGCPGGCQARRLGAAAPTLRVALGDGAEAWPDMLAGPSSGPVAPSGDLVVRDRHGNWTYGFCVVVDDQRQGVDLVIRGRDLLQATPAQIRLARLLGRVSGPTFLHHPLVQRPDGSKLSKSSGDTGVRELRRGGLTAQAVFGMVVAALHDRDAAAPLSAAAAWARLSGSGG